MDTIFSSDQAFAAKLTDGSIVTWGGSWSGGDSSSVQVELKQGVVTIFSTGSAFAAKLSDGSVVTWGNARGGGDSSSVQAKLKQGVDTIFTNGYAFAAYLTIDKTNSGYPQIVAWGDPRFGGEMQLYLWLLLCKRAH